MNLTVGKRLTCGFATLTVITVGIGGLAAYDFSKINTLTNRIATDSLPGTAYAGVINANVHACFGTVGRIALTDRQDEIPGLVSERKQILANVTKAVADYASTATAGQDQVNFDKLKEALSDYVPKADHVIALAVDGKVAEAREFYRAQTAPSVLKVFQQAEVVSDYNNDEGNKTGKETSDMVVSATRMLWISMAGAVVVSALLSWLISRSLGTALGRLVKSLAASADHTSAASSQVAASSQSLAQGASEQAASLEETSSSLEEIASMTKKNADTAHQASLLSAESKAVSDKGKATMSKMGGAIADIQKSASETAKIVKTIDEIAFQTNLLALNAAVEAARAGEAGKGFAVVAEEVRNLAIRSADAAKKTAELIEGSVQNAKNGVIISDEVAKSLDEITTATGKVNQLVSEIAAACQEQTQGVGQVNEAVQQMDKVTQSNAAAAEESAASAEELTTQSEGLRSVVKDLIVLVEGASASSASPAAAAPAKRTFKPAVKASKKAHDAFPLNENEAGDFSDFNIAA